VKKTFVKPHGSFEEALAQMAKEKLHSLLLQNRFLLFVRR
jgi:hypothetical protein